MSFIAPKPEDLRRILSSIEPVPIKTRDAPAAAVLILIYSSGGNLFIPLTLRSKELPVHAGQICLPGGRVHATDASIEATALREAFEEIGTSLEPANVLGCLAPIMTNSGFAVTPVVAWTQRVPAFKLEPREVSELIALPLEVALDLTQYKQDSIVESGVTRDFCYIEYAGFRIWGATARILRSLASLMQ